MLVEHFREPFHGHDENILVFIWGYSVASEDDGSCTSYAYFVLVYSAKANFPPHSKPLETENGLIADPNAGAGQSASRQHDVQLHQHLPDGGHQRPVASESAGTWKAVATVFPAHVCQLVSLRASFPRRSGPPSSSASSFPSTTSQRNTSCDPASWATPF